MLICFASFGYKFNYLICARNYVRVRVNGIIAVKSIKFRSISLQYKIVNGGGLWPNRASAIHASNEKDGANVAKLIER